MAIAVFLMVLFKNLVLMRYVLFSILSVCALFFLSCGDDEKEVEYAKIYFPLATRADANEMFHVQFNYARDTSFIVRAYCAGSVLTPEDVKVDIELATEQLQEKWQTNPAFTAYELIPADAYTIDPGDLKLVIKKNTEGSDLKVHFKTSVFAAGKKYVLPLRIRSTSHYEISDKYGLLFFAIQQAN